MLRAILFDVDNTLVDRSEAARRYFADFIARVLPREDVQGRQRIVDELLDFDRWGYRGRDEYCGWVRRRLRERDGAAALSEEDIWEDRLKHLAEFVEPDPAITALVARLKSRYQVAIISNGGGSNQRTKLVRSGLSESMDQVFISGELGVEKPDPRIFAQALAKLNVRPAESLFVGDDPDRDIVGAAGAGMHTCWVAWGREFPASLRPPNFTIDTVHSLESVLC